MRSQDASACASAHEEWLRNGASPTTHAQERAFLAEVDRQAQRVEIEVIGGTAQGRPLHLVRGGDDAPSRRGTRHSAQGAPVEDC